jgi:Glycogen synthase
MRNAVLSLFVSLMSVVAFASSESPRVLMVTAEKGGVFQTGGLAHAVGGLAQALNEAKISTDVIMPFYLQMSTPKNLSYSPQHIEVGLDYRDGVPHKNSEFLVLKSEGGADKGDTIFLRHNPDSWNKNYFDNRSATKKFYGPEEIQGEAFGAWSKAVAEYIVRSNYDVVVLNDWHTGLVALYLDMAHQAGHKVPKVIMAIHNMAFQGTYSQSIMPFLGIPDGYFSAERGIEFWGQANFLKAGMQYSNLMYTVSQGYAQEIGTPLFGAGLDGLVRHLQSQFRVTGVLNGIINSQWDPAVKYHEAVQHTFTPADLSGKVTGKAALQKEMGLRVDASVPLFVMTSRVAEQKGFEYLIDALAELAPRGGAQFLVAGDGDAAYIARLKELQSRFPDRFQYRPFSEHAEKTFTAYGDFFINAAWFEPSGLNQFFALKNGTLPVLSRVGGLANSIVEGRSGFFFDLKWKEDRSGYDKSATRASLVETIEKASVLFASNPATIIQMRKNAMTDDNSWKKRVNAEIGNMLKFVLADGPEQLRDQGKVAGSSVQAPSKLLSQIRASAPRCEVLLLTGGR